MNRGSGLSHLHLPLDPDVLEGVGLAVSVVKEELLSLEYRPFGKDPYPVIPIHHHHFCVAVGVDRMVCKADFVPFASGIYNKVIVQVEKETGHVFVVDAPTPIRLVLGDELSAVL